MNRTDRHTRFVLGALALAGALIVPSLAWAGPVAGAPGQVQASAVDQLPDLELAPLYGVDIKTTNKGRKRIRFGTRAFNIGAGPLEVRGRARDGQVMGKLFQWISDGKGGGREVAQNKVTMFWAGDGHNHWHVERFITVELYQVGKLSGSRRIRKIGFCLVDLVASSNPPAHASESPTYGFSSCGTKVGVKKITMGISVGWADEYFPTTTFQWIDITTLPKGQYRLCAKVNPLGDWIESNTANNYYWQDYWINAKKSVVSKRNSPGRTPCGSFR